MSIRIFRTSMVLKRYKKDEDLFWTSLSQIYTNIYRDMEEQEWKNTLLIEVKSRDNKTKWSYTKVGTSMKKKEWFSLKRRKCRRDSSVKN